MLLSAPERPKTERAAAFPLPNLVIMSNSRCITTCAELPQGKIENYYLPGQFEARLVAFVDYYNSRRYHESLNNLTPADVYSGRAKTVLTRRENIKLKTIELRRRLHHQTAASTSSRWTRSSLRSIANLSKKF